MNFDLTEFRASSRRLIRELGLLRVAQEGHFESPSAYHILTEAFHRPGISIGELSKLLLLRQTSVTKIVQRLEEKGWLRSVISPEDKRRKEVELTGKGLKIFKELDLSSNSLIENCFSTLSEEQVGKIVEGISLYEKALSKSRLKQDPFFLQNNFKIKTLTNSLSLRSQIVQMVSSIQRGEFGVAITEKTNQCILKAEHYYHYDQKCNFWYVEDSEGHIIGSIGLRKLSETQGEIKKCFVIKKYRGQGLAQLLMQKVFRRAVSLGMKEIFLGTVGHFVWAHKFYQKHGFIEVDKDNLPQSMKLDPADSKFFRCSIESYK